MDDPLIGLTIFDSRHKPSQSGPGRPVSSTSAHSSEGKRSRRSESVDSNKLQEEKGSKRERSIDKEAKTDSKNDPSKAKTSETGNKSSSKSHGGKKANSGGKGKPAKGSDIRGDLDKCFPCLPGLEEPPEKEEGEVSEGQSSSGSGESTPTSPVPHNETTGNHVDSGIGTLPVDTSPSTPGVVDSNILMNSPVPQPQNFWLMRLFQSKLFDMSIAIGYLFNSKDSDVQAYLGNKLFVSVHCICPPSCTSIV